MTKIPLYYYLAFNNPEGAVSVMEKFGYNVHARNKTQLATTIAEFITREKEDGLHALAAIHPDRELILATAGKKMGADGELETEISQKISEPSAPFALPNNLLQSNYTPLVLGGIFSLAIVTLAIVAKK